MQSLKSLLGYANDESGPQTPFGKPFRNKFFRNFDPEVRPVNHGSYGAVPEPIFHKFVTAMEETDHFPDYAIRFNEPDHYVEALKCLGDFFNCDYRNLAIVENATTGVNTVLRSFPFKKGDKVIFASTVYGSCGNVVKFLEKRYGIEAVIAQLDYPLNDDEVVQIYENLIKAHSPRLCMFDAVTSMPGVKMPFIELTKLCKKYGVISLVDGAHSAGLIPYDFSFSPDFFVTNLHKWLYVPRGCCALYVDSKHFNTIQTLPISHSYVDEDLKLPDDVEENLLVSKFTFTGTTYQAQLKCIQAAIEFRRMECGGEQAIYDYCHELALKVGVAVSKTWGTRYLDNDDKSLVTAMVNVEVPIKRIADECNANIELLKDPVQYKTFEDSVLKSMALKYKTFVPIANHNGCLWARFSCQIYNSFEDYEYAAKSLLQSMADYLKE
ncbi:uncharacterized protein PRCAT00003789001 [Priceomyces carsonii]|uniref:uncharacterized protein n=1 Tax=Priceomyces carsonii TaxID=28549 RepID=UPI002ED86473|nr:unnamed protein product [Priceomyces carsonii]